MPTTNPRINVTLRPETHARIKRISELTGDSQSAIVASLLEAQGEVFDRLILVLQAADKAQQHAKQMLSGTAMAEQLLQAQTKIEKQMGLALETFDNSVAPLLEQAETIGRRSKRGGMGTPAARASTPPSNRGVRYTPLTAKTIKKTRG